jgi:hypothetical protein
MSYLTWNEQGRHVASTVLINRFAGLPALFGPDYICLQEVGNAGWGGAVLTPMMPAPGELFEVKNLRLNHKQYNGYYLRWVGPGGNSRCSTAVLYRTVLGAHGVGWWWDGLETHRPVIWLVPAAIVPPAVLPPVIGCIHAPSGGGNLPYVLQALTAINAGANAIAPGLAWRLVGDFNIRYPQLTASKPFWPVALQIVATQSSKGATQYHGHDLDYSVGTLANTPNCVSAEAYLASDHLAVAFW